MENTRHSTITLMNKQELELPEDLVMFIIVYILRINNNVKLLIYYVTVMRIIYTSQYMYYQQTNEQKLPQDIEIYCNTEKLYYKIIDPLIKTSYKPTLHNTSANQKTLGGFSHDSMKSCALHNSHSYVFLNSDIRYSKCSVIKRNESCIN